MHKSPEIVYCDQGTPEWLALRVGVFTASQFDQLLTPAKLQPSKQRDGLIMRLAAEKIMGEPTETAQTAWMSWGLMYEDEARKWYAMETGEDVERPGFVYLNGDHRVGCSPDGLTKNGGLEIKCPKPETHLKYLLDGVLPREYLCQVQGCLYVTGKKHWSFCSYHPKMPPFMIMVEPDPEFFAAMDEVLPLAIAEMDAILAAVEAR